MVMKRLSLIFVLAIMMLCISCSTNDVMYFDYKIPKDMLSDTTLEWLEWFNSLSYDLQIAVSYIPSDLGQAIEELYR